MSLDDEWESPSGSGMLTTSTEAGRTSEDVAGSSLLSVNSQYSLGTGGDGHTCTGGDTRSVDSLTGPSEEHEPEESRSLTTAMLTSSNGDSSDESYYEDRMRG